MFSFIHEARHDWLNYVKTSCTFCVICFIFVLFFSYIYHPIFFFNKSSKGLLFATRPFLLLYFWEKCVFIQTYKKKKITK